MNGGIWARRWIVLSVLLLVSCTFLFLQIISLKAIDTSAISKYRVLKGIQNLLKYHNRREDLVVWEFVKTFSEVTRQHHVPVFLLYPVVTHSTKKGNLLDSTHNQDHAIQTSICEFLCDTQHIRFGVIDFEWQQMTKKQISLLISPFTADLQEKNFQVICYKVQEPWFDSTKDFLTVNLITSSCSIMQGDNVIELLMFYHRKSYLWHGPSHEKIQDNVIEMSGALKRLPIVERTVDRINLKVPSDPEKLLMERQQSRFIGCNVANAQHFYSKYGRDISPDAILFRQKALEVLKMAVTALQSLQVRFWLSSGTCLGWFRQCDIIPHSKDVDIGIWIKDHNPRLIAEFEKYGLFLKHKFGLEEDSLELSFRTKEDYVKLDIFFFYEEKNYMWNGGTQARTGKKFKYIFPKFSLCWTEFLELSVRVPCETKSYIMANYGKDWQVPIKEWNWKESPPNVRENGQWDEKDWDRVIQLL